ncbi:MAG: MFS transporter [Candidatus Nanopelagicales bacterium]|jgi:MFS family permease
MSFRSSSRDVAVVAAGRAVSLVGDEVALVALLLWASDQGHGAGVVAALVVAAALPQLLVAPVAGLAADRLPLRRLVAATAVAQSLLCLLVAAVLPSASVAAVIALVAVRAAGQTFLSPAWQAWVPALVPSERLSAALSTVQTATAGAALVGPALGGILVGAAGVQWALVVDAVSFLGIAAAALLISRQPERTAVSAGGAQEKGQLTAGLRIVAADPVLRGFLVVIATMVVALGALNVAEVFLITDVLGAGPAAYGAVASLFALGLMGGAAFGRRNRTDSRLARLLVASTVLMSASAVVLGLAPSIAVAAAASFCVGLGNGLLNVLGQTLTVRRTPRDRLGRVFAVVQAVAGAGALVATAVGGLLLALLEVRTVVVLCGAVTVVAVLAVGRSLVRAADRPRVAAPEPERAASAA